MEINKLCFDWEEMLKMVLDMLIPVAQVLRLYIQMFLSYGLYVMHYLGNCSS